MADAQEQALSLLSLPPALQHEVFRRLPVDMRMRCREVSPGWRAALNDASLWTRLNLAPWSGVKVPLTPALLRAAAARAHGTLTHLGMMNDDAPLLEALLEVVRANSQALRVLSLGGSTSQHFLEALLRAAPALQAGAVQTGVVTTPGDAPRVLRGEPPFQALRMHTVDIEGDVNAHFTALSRALRMHTSLRSLKMQASRLRTRAATDAVVDAAVALSLGFVRFSECSMTPQSALALPRLLLGGALTDLTIDNVEADAEVPLLDAHAALGLAAALRATRTLRELVLFGIGLWRDPALAAPVLQALTGHPCVRLLDFSVNNARHAAVHVGRLLAAVVAANAPALRVFNVQICGLGDAGLTPLLNALAANTHLCELNLGGNDASPRFVRSVMVPAQRANTGVHIMCQDAATGIDALDAAFEQLDIACV